MFFLRYIFLIFSTFFLDTIKQNPTPQLKVFIISLSETFLLFNHLNILGILIFEKSKFKSNLSGTDLIRFSIKPPPVICAAALIRFLLANFKTSSVYILVGFNNSFFKFFGILFFLI